MQEEAINQESKIDDIEKVSMELNNSDTQNPKAIIEAFLFVSEKPLPIEDIRSVLDGIEISEIKRLIDELRLEYQSPARGLRIEEVAGGFQIVTSKYVADALKKFYKQRDAQRLSAPALETLAIIAYKQPVTRLDIEALRGVNVDGVIKGLLQKGLIRISGRKEIIGRPFVYSTTRQFLEYFGLSSLDGLPNIEEFSKLPAANPVIENRDSSLVDEPVIDTGASNGGVEILRAQTQEVNENGAADSQASQTN